MGMYRIRSERSHLPENLLSEIELTVMAGTQVFALSYWLHAGRFPFSAITIFGVVSDVVAHPLRAVNGRAMGVINRV